MKIMTQPNIQKIYLCKYPRFLVVGEQVSSDQVEQIYESVKGERYHENPMKHLPCILDAHWLNEDGTILFDSCSPEKWPSFEIIINEWAAIAHRFTFLKMKITIYNEDYDEDDEFDPGWFPVAEIVIENGLVSFTKPRFF